MTDPQAAHLRLVVSQAQANFLVRRDGGSVRLQAIRDHMKAQGLACEVKLHDDKGSCEPPPASPPLSHVAPIEAGKPLELAYPIM